MSIFFFFIKTIPEASLFKQIFSFCWLKNTGSKLNLSCQPIKIKIKPISKPLACSKMLSTNYFVMIVKQTNQGRKGGNHANGNVLYP